MLPDSWTVRLLDCNTASITDDDFAWADLVFTGGMLAQQAETLRLIELCRSRGKPVIVGGPDPTSSPHIYAAADFQVLGEAECVIDEFVAAWEIGARSGVFTAPKFQADVTKMPVPRFDLLKFQDYLYLSVQYSRGGTSRRPNPPTHSVPPKALERNWQTRKLRRTKATSRCVGSRANAVVPVSRSRAADTQSRGRAAQ